MSTQPTTGNSVEEVPTDEDVVHASGASPEPASPSESQTEDEPGLAPDEVSEIGEDGIGLVELEEDPRIQELEQSLSELQARLRAVSAAYKQQQDDRAAARERLNRQAALKEEVRRGEVVATLFDPVQNLQRSVDAARKGSSMEDMLLGLEMLQNQFLEAFKTLGLEEVPGQGSRFNPNLHEALTMVPVEDPKLDDVVIEVFSAGYRIGSRLITPARVIVGQLIKPEPEDDEESAEIVDVDSEVVAPEGNDSEDADEVSTDGEA